MTNNGTTLAGAVGRGMIASVAGTAVMTAFQKLVEMPLTGRADSYAPASFAEKVLPVHPASDAGRKRLNYVTHFALGTMWGSAFGIARHMGLRGQNAVAVVFGTVYTADVLLNTALGLYKPMSWTKQDIVIDIGEKLIQAEATSAVFDRL